MKYDCRESELETVLRLKNQHFESLTEARQEIERLHLSRSNFAQNLMDDIMELRGQLAKAHKARAKDAAEIERLRTENAKLAKVHTALQMVGDADRGLHSGLAVSVYKTALINIAKRARQTLKEIGE